MRAVFLDKEIADEEFWLEEKQAHHLINVLRIKEDSQILGLNGIGTIYTLLVSEVKKKKVLLKVLDKIEKERTLNLDLAVGKVKKEAMDLSLKQACELGFENILILETEYAQRYDLKNERVKKLLISSIEQANNPYIPNVSEQKLTDLNFSDYENIIYFSSNPELVQKRKELKKSGKSLLLIGPEGGLSQSEEEFLNGLDINTYHLDTCIMRTPTAISCGVGFYLGALSQK